ncbi:putative endo-beta-1,4-glucanase D [Aspergillus ambiguus]|uniref:putative endoglucanase n=1 Tax=Aspergillus ambiguus TaxID=176160 RepID=UPI003CCDD456
MRTSFGLLALAAAAKLVDAHATVFAVWINDEDQGLGNTADGYIRSPPNNNPVMDVTSSDMTCNVNGDTAAAKTLPVKAGDKVTFEWHHNSRDSSDDIIASSHLGPVMVYMAPTEKGSAGNGWVKIAEDGYTDGTWAVETLIANRGKHSITVPDVPAGNYLFRPEIIALHEGNREGGAQFYMECVQLEVTSDGSNALPEGVSIPGAYTATDPGILFDIYSSFNSYPIPGPDVWDGSSSGASSGSSATTTASPATTSAEAPTTTAAPSTTEAPAATTAAPIQTKPAETTSSSTVAPAPSTFLTAVKPTATAEPVPSSDAGSCSASPSTAPATGSVKIYQQCGGINYSGSTTCESGLTCKKWNPYYHQCIEA